MSFPPAMSGKFNRIPERCLNSAHNHPVPNQRNNRYFYEMPPLESAVKAMKKMPFTLGMIAINTMAFILTVVLAGTWHGPDWTVTLLRMGAQFNPLALDREWYRIFTHIFLHAGILHLLTNIYVLAYAGAVMEPRVGTKKFAFLYFVCGFAAALSGLYWNLFTIGTGASGAIAGILGFSLVHYIFFPGKSSRPMAVLLLHFTAFVSINLIFPEQVHADYAAQFGGVLAGILAGFFTFAARQGPRTGHVKVEYLMTALLVVVYLLLPRNQVRYFRFFKQVVAAEDTTRYLLREKLTDDDMRVFIRNYHHWDDILARLKDQTNLPAALATDTFKLRKYIGLRKQENLFKKMVVQREAYVYLDSVEYLQAAMSQYMDLDYGLWSRIRLRAERPDSSSLSGMVKVFYDSDWVEKPSPPAAFYRIGIRDSLGAWTGWVRDHDASGNIRMKGTYKNNKRDGVFLYYSDHNTHSEAGRYVDGRRFGKWETFHPNGKIAGEVFYNSGYFVRSLWDSLGNRLVVDGNGREIQRYPNGVVAVEGEYRHGVKEGYWYGRHPNGELYFEENFNQGKLVAGKSRTLQDETFVYDESSLSPMPEGGFENFHAYVKARAKEVDPDELGHVKISFRVTRKGVLTDLTLEQRATPALDAKAKEIILNGPRWLPARRHGHEPVEGKGELLIEFY